MRYFKREDFDKCMEFLADKPDTVETQQELYKFMNDECHMFFNWNPITVKDMSIYSKVYKTSMMQNVSNWSATMSDGSMIVWNRNYHEFFRLEEIGMGRCSYVNYLDTFPEINDMLKDTWLLENWSDLLFQAAQKQLVAIWNGKYNEHFKNYWRK